MAKGIPEEMFSPTPEVVEMLSRFRPLTITIDPPEASACLLGCALDDPVLSRWMEERAPKLIVQNLEEQVEMLEAKHPRPDNERIDITSKEGTAWCWAGGLEHFPYPVPMPVDGVLGRHVRGFTNTDPLSQMDYPSVNHASYEIEAGPFALEHHGKKTRDFTQGLVCPRHAGAFFEAVKFKKFHYTGLSQGQRDAREQAAIALWDATTDKMGQAAHNPPSDAHIVDPVVKRTEEEWRAAERFRTNTENLLPGVNVKPFQVKHLGIALRFWHTGLQRECVYMMPTFRSIAGDCRGDYVEADYVCESFAD